MRPPEARRAIAAALVAIWFFAARPAFPALNSSAPETNGNDIAAIISMVVEAHGGYDAVMRASEHFARGRIRDEAGGQYKTYAHYAASRTRLRVDTSYEGRSETRVLNGRRGTISRNGFLPESIEGVELLRLRFQYLCISMPRILAAEQYIARDLKVVSGAEGTGYVFRVVLAAMPEVTVEVDAATGLIRKMEAVLVNGEAAVLAGMRMSAYTEVDGTLLPMRMTMLEDGRPLSSIEVMAYSPAPAMSGRLFE